MLRTFPFLISLAALSVYDALTPPASCGPQQTILNEGEVLCCYKDSKGILTIGIGFNLQRKDASQVMARYNLTLADVLKDCNDGTTKSCLTDAAAKDIFNTISYPESEKCADAYAPGLPPVKRAAVIDVAFAGCKTLKSFTTMQTALKNGDWKAAAAALRGYKWCKDVKANRCNSDATCIEGIEGCAGQTCGQFTPNCSSSNPSCYCFKTSNGNGFCSLDFLCNSVPDCTSCLPPSVCVVDGCCGPKCVPESLGSTCQDPPTTIAFKSEKTAIFKRPICNQDNDCKVGTVCKAHATGNRCA